MSYEKLSTSKETNINKHLKSKDDLKANLNDVNSHNQKSILKNSILRTNCLVPNINKDSKIKLSIINNNINTLFKSNININNKNLNIKSNSRNSISNRLNIQRAPKLREILNLYNQHQTLQNNILKNNVNDTKNSNIDQVILLKYLFNTMLINCLRN